MKQAPDIRPLIRAAHRALHEMGCPQSTQPNDPKVCVWLTVKLNLEEAHAYLNGYFEPDEED